MPGIVPAGLPTIRDLTHPGARAMLKAEFDTLVPAQRGFKRRDFARKAVGRGVAAAELLRRRGLNAGCR
jgi:hypothetical protein